jgi:hypothetical protein
VTRIKWMNNHLKIDRFVDEFLLCIELMKKRKNVPLPVAAIMFEEEKRQLPVSTSYIRNFSLIYYLKPHEKVLFHSEATA